MKKKNVLLENSTLHRVLAVCIVSRLILFVSQMLLNYLFDDFDTSTWISDAYLIGRYDRHNVSEKNGDLTNYLRHMFNGINKWDSVYFNQITIHGYTYEQMLAFFPGFPYLVSTIFLAVRLVLPRSVDSQLVIVQITGFFLNSIFHVLATVVLYYLTEQVIGKSSATTDRKRLSFVGVTTYLFIANPANVFMTSSYSESLFVFMQFSSLLAMEKSYFGCSAILVGMTTLIRSNAILNVAFLVYFFVKHKLLVKLQLDLKQTSSIFMIFSTPLELFRFCFLCWYELVQLFGLIGLSLAPFVTYQYEVYRTFCKLPHVASVSGHWCQAVFPLSYSYIQRKYWNFGYFRYYEMKQIPNFILAAPVVFLILSGVLSLLSRQNFTKIIKTLGLLRVNENDESKFSLHFIESDRVFVYACHALFLTIFGMLNVHVQILTRMICSSTPFLYWHVARVLLSGGISSESDETKVRCLKTAILCYLVFYNVTGLFLHCNFYPWT